jgi:hypothetical protein
MRAGGRVSMPTQSQIEAQKLYANVLEEIKLRIAAIDHCTLGFSGIAPPFVKDFCYPQIRMICELVALGCLVARGDIKQSGSSKLRKEWSADRIMSSLEALHPHFYPQPVKKMKTVGGFHLQRIATSLSKSDFLELYGKCRNLLHRGNIRKLLKGQLPEQINYPEITKKAQKLLDLLSNHVMLTHTGEQMFLAMLNNVDDNNRVQVALAETPKGQPMDFKSSNFLKDPA